MLLIVAAGVDQGAGDPGAGRGLGADPDVAAGVRLGDGDEVVVGEGDVTKAGSKPAGRSRRWSKQDGKPAAPSSRCWSAEVYLTVRITPPRTSTPSRST
ncbi:hypothetical protein [Streptomyces canus]|uniref:hypothetical protein n=1 Tax=Streptomyces canus TaxID=58343 RepID=UPI0027D79B46|nr:hypothetical protein [Streptomyces canus]